ncbi:MAG: tRNA (adenosine(37)-N6)-threonylcarbamoyltransferase complex dimerization subunit type 1 TsaB, partial [Gammaproteobacteria bacterium]|nr:tRNA (adenosine(37)-N6)-threonylcarbamoyltransferase complex dimerization subunit type 1 TsaB [Gammaproteobacteria bacterium]
VERMHNEVVLTMIDDLCERAGLAGDEVDVVAFGAGPGSFTGVRIAAAVAQGIAFGTGAAIVPVASSLAKVHCAVRNLTPTAARVVTMTRSHRDAYYLAGFTHGAGVISQVVEDVLCTGWPTDFEQSDWVAVGDKPPWWGSDPHLDEALIQWAGEIDCSAAVIAELGIVAYATGKALDPAAGLPIYVDGDSPWNRLRHEDP